MSSIITMLTIVSSCASPLIAGLFVLPHYSCWVGALEAYYPFPTAFLTSTSITYIVTHPAIHTCCTWCLIPSEKSFLRGWKNSSLCTQFVLPTILPFHSQLLCISMFALQIIFHFTCICAKSEYLTSLTPCNSITHIFSSLDMPTHVIPSHTPCAFEMLLMDQKLLKYLFSGAFLIIYIVVSKYHCLHTILLFCCSLKLVTLNEFCLLGVSFYAYVCDVRIKDKNNFITICTKIFLSICRFIYETEHHNGVAELLEILGR